MNKIEKIFVIISLVIGSILILIVPPFNSPDEQSHFIRAYEISKGNILPKSYDGVVGFKVSKNIVNYIKEMESYAGNYDKKYSYSKMKSEQLDDTFNDEEIVYSISTARFNFIPYLIPAVGIQITDYLPYNSIVVMLHFARFILLIFCTIIGYFAIKITPKYKKSMFFILLLPNSLLLRSMVTYDGILLSTTALSLAMILKLIHGKPKSFSKIDFLTICYCGFMLLNIKIIYSFIFILMLAIPYEVFGTKKDKYLNYTLMVLLVLSITLICKIPYFFIPDATSNLVELQKAFIINNPINTFNILTINILKGLNTQIYWMIGTFGLLDTYMPVLSIFIIFTYLILIIINDSLEDKIKINKIYQIILFILLIACIYAIYLAMYYDWTPVVTNITGGNIVEGVQGRYFIPLLLTLPVIFQNKIIIKNNILNKFISNSYIYVTITSLIITIIVICTRFYI